MSTSDVKLVPALPEHLEAWMAMRDGPTSRRLLPLDDTHRESLLKRLREASSDVTDVRAKSFRWMVEVDGRIAGTVSARELSRFHGRVEVGYMLAEEFIGRGIGTRAVTMMLERLFSIPELHRI